MRRGMMQGSGKKEPNIIFRGLGGGLLTPAELVEDIYGAEKRNVKNWIDDGTDLYVHINTNNLELRSFGSNRDSTPTRLKICENLSAIEDENGLITSIVSNTLYNTNNSIGKPITLNLKGLKTISDEGLRDVRKLIAFDAPNLEQTIGVNPLTFTCYSNGDLPVDVSFPNLYGDSSHRNNKFNYLTLSPLVTGVISLTRNNKVTQFPFENATSWQDQCFRDCVNLEGEISMVNATGAQPMYLTFNNIPKVTKITIPNVTKLTRMEVGTSIRAINLEEWDIRSCKEFISIDTLTDDRTSNFLTSMTASKRAQLIIHAHVNMKTYNSGAPQATFADVIALGGTVNWYNNDGTFNSTN